MEAVSYDWLKKNMHYVETSLGTEIQVILEPTLMHEAPVEDLYPQVHAKWIRVKESMDVSFRCSNCDHVRKAENNTIERFLDLSREDSYRFCSYCGAKMDFDVLQKANLKESIQYLKDISINCNNDCEKCSDCFVVKQQNALDMLITVVEQEILNKEEST